jgi:hypothetical protein
MRRTTHGDYTPTWHDLDDLLNMNAIAPLLTAIGGLVVVFGALMFLVTRAPTTS